MPCIIITSYGLLALQPDLRPAIPLMIGITAVVTILLAVVYYAGDHMQIRWSPFVIILTAAAIRLFFLFRPPELSDDIFRYLWDGLQTLSGHNPYSMPPSEVLGPDATRKGLLNHINHPDLITIYPPASQLVFAAGAALGGKILGLKTLLILMDLITCFMLIRLLATLAIPAWRSIIYAWHPLPVIEIAASGHIDGAGTALLLLTFLLLMQHPYITSNNLAGDSVCPSPRRLRSFLAGTTFACATLIKLFPIVFLPCFFTIVPNRARLLFSAGFITGITFLTLPFLPDIGNCFVTLGIYLHQWEFSGFLFRTFRDMSSSGNLSRLMLFSLFLAASGFIYAWFWKNNPLGHQSFNAAYPVFKALYSLSLIFLLLTPTLYPWYALMLVSLLPLVPGTAGIVLCWSVFLSYYVLIAFDITGQWKEHSIIPAAIFLSTVIGSLPTFLTQIRRNSS
jgi:hypothetical protein